MPLEVRDNGTNNAISIDEVSRAQISGLLELNGNDNHISIAECCFSTGQVRIVVGSGCTLRIGHTCSLAHNFIYMASDTRLSIGHHTAFNGTCEMQLHEPSEITVGPFCLFGGDTNVMTSDMHAILDVETGLRINPAEDVLIESTVWIGARSVILKGCHIGAGSIIGLGAVVTGDVPRQAVAAGNPARIVRTGVTWRGGLLAP